MRSKANIKGHPIHPMLIAFPIAFFSGTLIFDLLSVILDNQNLWQTAYYLEIGGIISALLAAVPGIIDYAKVVPPKSSAKKRAAQHGVLNTTHVIIFFIAWWLRKDEGSSIFLIISLEIIGVVILFIAGWLGGTLVYRNQIGMDIRYANKGKWQESYHDATADIEIGNANELGINQMKLLHIGDKRIVLGRTEEGYVAFDDHCTHRGGSLAAGTMICGTVQCPWHGSQFNVKTGCVAAGPAKDSINVYKVEEIDGKLKLRL
jgi:uncharacterized membrane protein/nitrite reductase/ring-hydroxylating ferredoxin subunit